jgi:hypothetical protein
MSPLSILMDYLIGIRVSSAATVFVFTQHLVSYCVLQIGSETRKTKTKMRTLNPVS